MALLCLVFKGENGPWRKLSSLPSEHGGSVVQISSSAAMAPAKPARRRFFPKWSMFRPVLKHDNAINNMSQDEAKKLAQKSTHDKIFNPEFTREMQEHYRTSVQPNDSKITPYYHANTYMEQQTLTDRHEMANWTTREVFRNEVREMFNNADPDSAPLKVVHVVKKANGGEDPNASPNQPSANGQTNTTVANQAASTPAPTAAQVAQQEEEQTKLKAKVNVFHQQGELHFTNPIVTTSVNVDLTAAHATQNATIPVTPTTDPVYVDMKKDIKVLDVNSNVKYGVTNRVMAVTVSKKITDQISCNANSQVFTGDTRAADGSKSQQSLSMNYSLSF